MSKKHADYFPIFAFCFGGAFISEPVTGAKVMMDDFAKQLLKGIMMELKPSPYEFR